MASECGLELEREIKRRLARQKSGRTGGGGGGLEELGLFG